MRNVNFKIYTYILDRESGYSNQYLENVKIICYDGKFYVLQTMNRLVLDWYTFYINHSGGIRIAKIIREVCYWKSLVTQAELYAKPCKIYINGSKLERLFIDI